MYRDWLEIYKEGLFNPKEAMEKFSVFKLKAYDIISHNKDETQTWTKGLNAWSDLTDSEFEELYPLMDSQECSATNTKPYISDSKELLPTQVDWRKSGVISDVKD